MRALPIAALLLLAACANGGNHGQAGEAPGVDVADAALRGGSPQVALRIDDAILAKDPHNVAALLNRGEAQTALQQSDAATQSYTEALRADPDSVPARIGLGRLRLADDPTAAETLFVEVLRRSPRNAVALNDLGIARDLLGRHEDAQAAYRQTIGIDPSMNGARVNLALSLAMVGRADDAAPMLRPLASAPNAPRRLRHDLAAVLAMGGDRNQAQRILAQDLSPDQVDQALAIFTAASTPSGPVPAIGAPPPLSAGGSASGDLASGGLASGDSASDDPTRDGPPSADLMVQLSSTTSSHAAAAEWRRIEKRMPDLLADRQPIVVRSETAGRVLWGVRTAGFAGLGEAKAFCGAVKARGASCYVIGS
jgi:Flp pilus assembly protein TadD